MEFRNYIPNIPWEQQRNLVITEEDYWLKAKLIQLPQNERKKLLFNEMQSLTKVICALENEPNPQIEPLRNDFDESGKKLDNSESGAALMDIVVSISSFFKEKYSYKTILEEIHHCCGDIAEAINVLSNPDFHPSFHNVLDFTNFNAPKEKIEEYISGARN